MLLQCFPRRGDAALRTQGEIVRSELVGRLHLGQSVFDLSEGNRFAVDLVHAALQGLLHVLLLRVAGHRHYPGLFKTHLGAILADLGRRLVAVQVGHVAVHEDQVELVGGVPLLDSVDGLQPVESPLNLNRIDALEL